MKFLPYTYSQVTKLFFKPFSAGKIGGNLKYFSTFVRKRRRKISCKITHSLLLECYSMQIWSKSAKNVEKVTKFERKSNQIQCFSREIRAPELVSCLAEKIQANLIHRNVFTGVQGYQQVSSALMFWHSMISKSPFQKIIIHLEIKRFCACIYCDV